MAYCSFSSGADCGRQYGFCRYGAGWKRGIYPDIILRSYTSKCKHAQKISSKRKGIGKDNVRTIVLIGDSIADQIIEPAEKENVDLIVIGNVGLSGLSKLKALGSVSGAVNERAHCAVMIVR